MTGRTLRRRPAAEGPAARRPLLRLRFRRAFRRSWPKSEYELYKLGVPVKTRHNEVAPAQFEIAPIFEEANIATDHNQLTMEMLRKVATRHNFAVLCTKSPSPASTAAASTTTGRWRSRRAGRELDGDNLLDPGKTPHQNIRFLLCLMARAQGRAQARGPAPRGHRVARATITAWARTKRLRRSSRCSWATCSRGS